MTFFSNIWRNEKSREIIVQIIVLFFLGWFISWLVMNVNANFEALGKDISFEFGRLKGFRNFCTKMWNAARFIDGYPNEKDKFKAENDHDKWIYDEFSKAKKQINKNISDYRLDFAVNEIYEFFWNKFCDVYIEQCKKSGETSNLRPLLKEILQLVHPFAPFITEEINTILFDERIIT